jgi:hypothetical protein
MVPKCIREAKAIEGNDMITVMAIELKRVIFDCIVYTIRKNEECYLVLYKN